ncbi:MAG TPA: tripartite tricarboxylate transporter TctB family protein [Xanthobacteraceae bacterium]|nr:tripartite tricarboxylate transporter TctB family protein [Xanthobacteraceae bacterium]
MNEHVRDRIVGTVLIVFAAVWCGTVLMTVPSNYGGALVGPRDVPLWLGIGLAALALALIVNSYFGNAADGAGDQPESSVRKFDRKSEWWAVGVVAGSLLAYALFMEWFGFVVATIAVIVGLLRFALGVRSLPVIVGMSVCMSFGIYFVMGWLMGVYLPHGTVISLF